ncbi:MAG: lytic transglycosylase domain-containing protein [Caulobacter sp.]|nr:lytic transglycosylase domain-containing protein [Caulobacter sp.]
MTAGPRTLVVALTMMALAIFSGGTALAAGPEVLSPMDERAYREAFAASQRGDFEDAEAAMARIKDRALAGRLAFEKLMHPAAYTATYAELTAWLKTYGDQPGAERIYALAIKRKPAGAADPKPPAFMEVSRLWGRVESASSLAGGPASPDRGRAAREAYYSGDATRALALAPAAGERWVAGLAAWRLSRFEEARGYFRAVAIDENQDDWLRAAGAFWAARASTRLGEADQAAAFLRMAARAPQTFYGMIAQRALELQGARLGAGPGDWRPALAGAISDYGYTRVATEPARPAIESFVRDDRRAHRATALMQIGRAADAGLELRAGLTLAKTPAERQQWQALVLALNAPLTTAADAAPPPSARRPPTRRPPETYPAPELWPEGGFTLDKALVYALVWKESRFNSFAVSGAGAMGLMQVRPVAAARAAGDDKLLLNPMPLLDAPTNLRVGQDYFIWLMERALGGGAEAYDILRAVAAYNAGAGTVLNTIKKLGGGEVDSLLLMESLPALETRDYVEKVMVAYWTYKQRFGGETHTLDALARGERIIDIRLDR